MHQKSGLPIVAFENASIARGGETPILRNVSWTIREGETWAVVGPMGSGKTTLAEAVLGRHRIVAGTVAWPLLDALRQKGRGVAGPSAVMRLVSFKEESRLFSYSGRYFQQRFEFADADAPLTLDDFLRAGAAADADVEAVAERLGLAGLGPRSFIKLSNGQVRRARIARALLGAPELLVLDDPFVGLDVAGRAELGVLLAELVGRGERILLVVDEEAIPECVSHVLKVEGGTAGEVMMPFSSTSPLWGRSLRTE